MTSGTANSNGCDFSLPLGLLQSRAKFGTFQLYSTPEQNVTVERPKKATILFHDLPEL